MLLLFICLAGFVIVRLISVLGERTGHEQRPDIEGLQRAAHSENDREPTDERSDYPEPAPAAVSPEAAVLAEADADFNEREFLTGAKAAYEMIVEAFAAGDLKSVRDYVDTAVYEAFRAAVSNREAANQTFDLKFVGVEDARIIESRVENGTLVAVAQFTSNQVRVTRDASGEVVDGDPNRIDLVRDRWTFSRQMASRDPNWTLTATGGA
ncbi:MAG: Tim44/TimA family putative adaptor protein [Pseudomonadota bacterium]